MYGTQGNSRRVPPLAHRRRSAPHEIRRLHDHAQSHLVRHNLTTLLHVALMAGAVWSWLAACWPITLLCWAAAGHVAHSKLIAFHEASHGTLNRRRWLNELQGLLLGAVILVPLSAYRYVHGQHHASLGTPRDLELWPFVAPAAPRWLRCCAAAAELLVGFFYTPILFLRGVLVGRNIPARQRRRIAWEYAGGSLALAVVLSIVLVAGWWQAFLVGFLAPAVIAGNLQSLRKFTEHLGLLGDSILTTTRTVVDRRPAGQVLSESMLHIDYHGTHHRYARVPFYNLPPATPQVYTADVEALPIFSSYTAAMIDMLPALADPRVGAQWRGQAFAARPIDRKRAPRPLRGQAPASAT